MIVIIIIIDNEQILKFRSRQRRLEAHVVETARVCHRVLRGFGLTAKLVQTSATYSITGLMDPVQEKSRSIGIR